MPRASLIRRERGSSLVELALVLPVLLFLAFAAFDFSRAIQMNNVLVNLTREGASLMSRNADSPVFAQFVMNALGDTAMPTFGDTGQTGTYFEQNSAILVTQIKGKLNTATKKVDATVVEQYKWIKGYIPVGHIWTCGSGNWKSDGSCAMPATLPVVVLQVPLNDGDTVYAVEAFNNYQAMFGGLNLGLAALVPSVGPNLYAVAMF